jgi:hypothetical protein
MNFIICLWLFLHLLRLLSRLFLFDILLTNFLNFIVLNLDLRLNLYFISSSLALLSRLLLFFNFSLRLGFRLFQLV